ncbi:MAG: Ig-like domain-containing protein, partial [Oscillospiraceae bacterium]|nr:Ig-like domain-containing protein [Oscillospiraceae bacterium]
AASSEATAGGKNAAAEIFATLTIGGVSRTGKTSVTTAGYDLKLLYAEAKIMPETVEVGNGAQVEQTGYMSDGTVADMSGGRIVYESLTPEVISVDESGKITTLRAGKGKVAVTLVLSGASAYAEGEITVTDSSAIVSASLSGPGTVGYLRDEPLIITGRMESGYDADIDYSQVRWIIGSKPDGGIEIIDGNLVFGNVKGAKATISAEIKMGGATVSTNEIEVEVVESDLRDFVLNFGGVEEKELSDVTIEKYGWALDIENSHSSALASYLYNHCIYVQTNGVDRDFAIDFEVPYTGYFTPVFVAGMSDGYGSEKTYIYIDGEYVGDYKFYMEQIALRNLRAVYLEAGPHKLALRPVAKDTNSRNHYQYPGKVRFAAIPSLPGIKEIVTEKDEYEIAAGKTASVSAKLKLTDGFVYEWQKMRNGDADPHISVKYSSDNTDIATVDENGIITAVAEGNCKITVTVAFNGIETPKEIPVSVLPEGSIAADEVLDNVEIEAPYFVMNPEASGIQLTAVGKNDKGTAVDMTGAEIIWEIEDNSVAEISKKGFVTPAALGSAKVIATVTLGGITKTGECYVSVREGKVGRTYYTDEMVAAAQENIKK